MKKEFYKEKKLNKFQKIKITFKKNLKKISKIKNLFKNKKLNLIKIKSFFKTVFLKIKSFFKLLFTKIKLLFIKIFKNKEKRIKFFIVLNIILAIILVLIIGFRWNQERIKKDKAITVDMIELKIYYSQSSRDENRHEQYEFNTNDPIQAQFKFKNAEKNTLIFFYIKKDEKIIRQHAIVLETNGDEEGNRFVTLVTNGYPLESGNYDIEIYQAGYKLIGTNFSIK